MYICICNFNNDLQVVSACLVDTCSLYAYSLCVRLANRGMLTSYGPLVSLLVSMDVHCATLLFVSRCISSFVFKRYLHLYFIFATILSLWSLFNWNQDHWHCSFDCGICIFWLCCRQGHSYVTDTSCLMCIVMTTSRNKVSKLVATIFVQVSQS